MKALVLDAENRTANVQEIPKPQPGPDEALIRVEAVALNPVDALYVFNPLGATGRVVGSDFSGTVEALGAEASASQHLKPGDRVAGFVQGASSINARPGAFAEYVVSLHDLLWKVAPSMSAEEASTISLCALTAAQALFTRMHLPAPWSSSPAPPLRSSSSSSPPQDAPNTTTLYIHGASTSVGLYAAQLAHASATRHGYPLTLLGAASPHHHATLTAPPYAYTHLLNARSPTWPTALAQLIPPPSSTSTGGGLRYAFDCIAEGATVSTLARLMDPERGTLAVVRSRAGGAWDGEEALPLEPSYGAVWAGLGARVEYEGMEIPADGEARALAVRFYKWLEEEAGKKGALQANRVRVMPGGLRRVVDEGFVLLGGGGMGDRGGGEGNGEGEEVRDWMRPVSGEKLVYRV